VVRASCKGSCWGCTGSPWARARSASRQPRCPRAARPAADGAPARRPWGPCRGRRRGTGSPRCGAGRHPGRPGPRRPRGRPARRPRSAPPGPPAARPVGARWPAPGAAGRGRGRPRRGRSARGGQQPEGAGRDRPAAYDPQPTGGDDHIAGRVQRGALEIEDRVGRRPPGQVVRRLRGGQEGSDGGRQVGPGQRPFGLPPAPDRPVAPACSADLVGPEVDPDALTSDHTCWSRICRTAWATVSSGAQVTSGRRAGSPASTQSGSRGAPAVEAVMAYRRRSPARRPAGPRTRVAVGAAPPGWRG
jgi:hypothetical protein